MAVGSDLLFVYMLLEYSIKLIIEGLMASVEVTAYYK